MCWLERLLIGWCGNEDPWQLPLWYLSFSSRLILLLQIKRPGLVRVRQTGPKIDTFPQVHAGATEYEGEMWLILLQKRTESVMIFFPIMISIMKNLVKPPQYRPIYQCNCNPFVGENPQASWVDLVWFEFSAMAVLAKCYISPSPPKTALSLDVNSVEFNVNVCRALVEFQWLPFVSAAAALVPCNSI